MTRDEYARLKAVVASALECPEREQQAYLVAHCGPDGVMRREAASLLASVIQAGSCFEAPTLLVAGERLTPEAFAGADDITLPFITAPRVARGSGPDFRGTPRYAVPRRIGEGGMGIVYEVDDRERGQPVALKTLRHRSGDDVYQLKREFRNLADVAHPNLVALYDLVIDEEHCFFTMELVEGTSFVDYVRQGSSATAMADRVRQALPQLVAGVQELHRRGMQHRDIKPSNVLVTPGGRVAILDFGLTSGPLQEGSEGAGVAGTPAYLSPEQCLGGLPTDAGDWYSVGVMLYQALAGRVPFEGAVREVIAGKVTHDPPSVRALAPDVPADLDEVCRGLLSRDPAERLSGAAMLDRLRLASPPMGASARDASESVFVGREPLVSALDRAFASVKAGRSVSVVIHGPSGIGKSALVQYFIERRLERASVLVLRSRCHEHEAIPYKALDGLIDGITRALSDRPPAEAAALLPTDVQALARLFPVLRVLDVAPSGDAETDPVDLQRQAFAAFREMLGRLGARQPLVIDIDDLHWADADSIRWLTELLRPPSPASLLTLLSFRSEELEAKPLLRSLVERADVGERLSLPLTPLSDTEVARLVGTLLAVRGEPAVGPAAEIARASGGNPFLVDALTRYAALGSETTTGITLDQMLARRLDDLPAESRPFLEALAVCGRPALPARVFEACGLRGDERPLVARLRAAHFLRNSRTAERVEMYHDRIREALARHVSSEAAHRIHERLAEVLVEHGDDDPEALFEHYRGAGRTELAAAHAVLAADKARDVLAFDLAAWFYRQALHLQPESAHRSRWQADLARALENAGRPVEAAEAYLQAATQAQSADRLEWRRKAAELLLIGGQIDRGLAAIDDVLRTVGARVASSPGAALVSLVLRRMYLRWRGVELGVPPDAPSNQADLLRIDACWSMSVGMAMVDPLRAADVNVRQLLWALRVGDPYRVARGLALEAGFSTIIPVGAGTQRVEALRRQAAALAPPAGQHYVEALTSVWAGIGAFVTGRWKDSAEFCSRALTTLRDHCTGVTWELNLAQNFFLFSLVLLGELRQAFSYLPGLLRSARERGNVYVELELGTRMSLVWVAADEPDEAERLANEGLAHWSQRGFQRPHFHHLLTLIQTRLYRGQSDEAWDLLERHRDVVGQNQFRRVQHTRIEIANCRARCALARAAAGRDAPRMRAVAEREARRILGEHMAWSNSYVLLLRAAVAYQTGDVRAAVDALARATEGFDASGMQLHAALCRWRLSRLVDGARARALQAEADLYMTQQEVRDPVAMARLFAPGLPD